MADIRINNTAFMPDWWTATCGVLLLWLAACSSGSSLPSLGQDDIILAFGDSLTHGTGAKPSQSYPAILETLTGRRVINAGVPGELSAEGVERLPRVLRQHAPDMLILCHGGNDLLRDKDTQQLKSNLRTMVELAKSRDIPVVLLAIPEPGLWLSGAALYSEVAAALDLPLEDGIIAEIEGDPALKSDPIHPNAQGYRLMAEAVHELLQDSGAL
jgi:lysophospholipase L1-like esterase